MRLTKKDKAILGRQYAEALYWHKFESPADLPALNCRKDWQTTDAYEKKADNFGNCGNGAGRTVESRTQQRNCSQSCNPIYPALVGSEMTKKELMDAIMESMSEQKHAKPATRLQVESFFEAFSSVAAAELIGGGEIGIQGVGKLKVRETSARKGRNPRTGEEMEIAGGKKVVFVSGRNFKEAMRG